MNKILEFYKKWFVGSSPTSIVFRNRGNRQLRLGNYRRAISRLTKAINMDSQDALAYYKRADAQVHLRRYKNALVDYGIAINLELKNDFPIQFGGIDNKAQIIIRDYDSVDEELTKLINLGTINSGYFYLRGNFRLRKNDFRSIDDFSKIIELYPFKIKAYILRADTRSYFKDYLGAIADITKAIEINPNGDSYLLSSLSRAKVDYEDSLDLDPAQKYYLKGKVKRENKEYDEGRSYLLRAIKFNPKFEAAFILLGLIEIDIKKFSWAINSFTKVIDINPSYSDAYRYRGYTKLKTEDYGGAYNDFTKAIEINPDDSDAYRFRGDTKLKTEDYRGAHDDFIKAIEINPDDHSAIFGKGHAAMMYNLQFGRLSNQDDY